MRAWVQFVVFSWTFVFCLSDSHFTSWFYQFLMFICFNVALCFCCSILHQKLLLFPAELFRLWCLIFSFPALSLEVASVTQPDSGSDLLFFFVFTVQNKMRWLSLKQQLNLKRTQSGTCHTLNQVYRVRVTQLKNLQCLHPMEAHYVAALHLLCLL